MTALHTFELPESVTGAPSDIQLGRDMIRAWQTDGIFQIARTQDQERITQEAIAASRRFFDRPLADKQSHVSDLTYSGYIASG